MMCPMRASSSTTESAYLLLESDLCTYSGAGRFGWCTFMKLTFMKNGSSNLARLVEKVERGLLDVESKKGIPTTPLSGVLTYWPLILKSSLAGSPALPESDPLVTRWNIARRSGSMSGNQVGSA